MRTLYAFSLFRQEITMHFNLKTPDEVHISHIKVKMHGNVLLQLKCIYNEYTSAPHTLLYMTGAYLCTGYVRT